MGDDQKDAPGTVHTVPPVPKCDYCSAELPEPKNHNGIVPRFCRGNRCRSAWHTQEKKRVLERARAALQAAVEAIDALLERRG